MHVRGQAPRLDRIGNSKTTPHSMGVMRVGPSSFMTDGHRAGSWTRTTNVLHALNGNMYSDMETHRTRSDLGVILINWGVHRSLVLKWVTAENREGPEWSTLASRSSHQGGDVIWKMDWHSFMLHTFCGKVSRVDPWSVWWPFVAERSPYHHMCWPWTSRY